MNNLPAQSTRNQRRLHRVAGIVLLLPFLAWSTTAMFFLIKPGYDQAYERLDVRLYPLESIPTVTPDHDWLEVRQLRTVLGEHLLVRTTEGWRQLDPLSLQALPMLGADALRQLVADAFSANPARYGNITEIDGNRLVTDTGVEVRLDWHSLGLSQQGQDTRRINQLYDIHYLRWTGIRPLDSVLGLVGLALLIYMTYSGARLAFRPRLTARTDAREQGMAGAAQEVM